MKIFVGGMKPHHQRNLVELFPEVEFVFASFQDNADKWIAKARSADVAVIDQARCSHKLVRGIAAARMRHVYFADTKPQIRAIIKEIILNGKARHSYAGTVGSESVAFGSWQSYYPGSSDSGEQGSEGGGAQIAASSSEC